MELENIILSYPGLEDQKPYVFSHMRNIDLIQRQQCYEKQVTLRGGHIRERKGKRRKLRCIYTLYRNEYRIFKPVEITIRRD
jgi:hypothetical protein